MVKRGIKATAATAVALQMAAVILMLLVVAGQQSVKGWYGFPDDSAGETIFPVLTMAGMLLLLVCLGVYSGIVFCGRSVSRTTKALAIVSLGLYGMVELLQPYAVSLETILAGRMLGAYALAALGTVRSAVSMVCGPFGTGAFALFALSVGGYVWGNTLEGGKSL